MVTAMQDRLQERLPVKRTTTSSDYVIRQGFCLSAPKSAVFSRDLPLCPPKMLFFQGCCALWTNPFKNKVSRREDATPLHGNNPITLHKLIPGRIFYVFARERIIQTNSREKFFMCVITLVLPVGGN